MSKKLFTFSYPQLTLPNPPTSIALVASHFNTLITKRLVEGALARLAELAIPAKTLIWVPGAVEIPITLQQLARTEQYEVMIALGAVIRGETNHYDYVCQQVSQGCQQVSLTYHIPIIFGVLTTDNVDQALDRVGGIHGHKGHEAVDAAVHMLHLFRTIR